MTSLRYFFALVLLGLAAACTADLTTPKPGSEPRHSSGIVGSGFKTDSVKSATQDSLTAK
ncbi:MAG: hypothetical protein JO040_09585 [Gemmatimonadetes bacterium]|nr:hypothetical protein [Gemmatimonadota bacterium]